VDSSRQRAQLGEGRPELVGGRLERRAELRAGIHRQLGPRSTQGERQGDGPLLGAVVEVALDPASLGVRRLDDPRPRGPHVPELRANLRSEALVLDGQADGGAHRRDEPRVLGQGGIVEDRCERRALALEVRDGAAGAVGLRIEAFAARVEVRLGGRRPVVCGGLR
jgi:hypothetical protein